MSLLMGINCQHPQKGKLMPRFRCPHCHHVTYSRPGVGSGRPKTCFYTAEGRTLHADQWADELNVSIQTVKNYQKRFSTFDEAVQALRSRE